MKQPIPVNEQTTQSLVTPPVPIKETRYIILHDGTVAARLKPRRKGKINYWSLTVNGHLKVLNQQRIDDIAAGK
jgi:hypothetical protein